MNIFSIHEIFTLFLRASSFSSDIRFESENQIKVVTGQHVIIFFISGLPSKKLKFVVPNPYLVKTWYRYNIDQRVRFEQKDSSRARELTLTVSFFY